MNSDEIYMQMTFDLASKGLGSTTPNPLVGAVLVHEQKIIGQGFHQMRGGAHAEVNAILNAKENGHIVSGATLYCNLEPCSHTDKRTPPCAQLLINEKISRVVIANIDPNPKVMGGGVKLLRDHNIEVVTGVLEEAGAQLNEVFFKYISTKMPFVHLKMGLSIDGRVATKTGESKYITGPESLKRVHYLRQKYDGVVVGRKTVELDDPGLTVRSPDFENPSHPWRIVIGSLNYFNYDWKIVRDDFKAHTIFVTSDMDIKKHPKVAQFLKNQGVKLLAVPLSSAGTSDTHIDLKIMLKMLAELEVTSLLIEGGPTLATLFLNSKLVDKVSFFIAPVLIGEGKNAILDLGVNSLLDKWEMVNKKIEILGNDILVEGNLCLPA